MICKKTSKNQITLPKKIVEAVSDTVYFDAVVESGRILLTPVEISSKETSLDGIRKKMKELNLTEYDVENAINSFFHS